MLCMLWSLSVLIHFLFLSWSMLNKFFVFITVHLETVCCGSQPAKSETVYCARTLTSAETDYAPEPTPP